MAKRPLQERCACTAVETLGGLTAVGAPPVLASLVALVLQMVPSTAILDINQVECFAGSKAVTLAARAAGRLAVSYERDDDPVLQDILTPAGFIFAVGLALKTEYGGIHVSAPVCSSWVFVNAATSGRSIAHPLGRAHLPYVAKANCMVARVCLLLYICLSRGVFLS